MKTTNDAKTFYENYYLQSVFTVTTVRSSSLTIIGLDISGQTGCILGSSFIKIAGA